jgi:AraC-like DNA-binding protein
MADAIRDDVHGVGASITVERRVVGDRASRAAHVTHQFAALAYYAAGSARIEQRNVWDLRAGDVLIVPAGEPHRARRTEGAVFWGLGFCVPCLPRHASARLLAPFDRVRAGGSAVVHIPPPRRAFLARLFTELQAALRDGATTDVQYSLLTLILHEVERATADGQARATAPGLVADALREIERRCLGPCSLADIATAVGRSPAHVTTALRKATGRSAGAWITAFRMAQARHLLLHADLPVDEVASRVGYADTTHFIRTFRRDHDATPAAWRDAARRSRDA